jgi:hypothetical protein
VSAPLIDGGLEHQVLGVGTYAMIANQLYVEVGGYSSLSAAAQRKVGIDPAGETELDHLAPYWRVALERNWGPHVFELGSFGLAARTFPARDNSAGHDRLNDAGIDLQYQYLSAEHDVTLAASWIHEAQNLRASRRLGLAEKGGNALQQSRITASYLFNKTFGFDLQYFQTVGKPDALLYGTRRERPDTNGWVFQLNFLPLNRLGGPALWPMSNARFSIQYTLYNRFNGARSRFDDTPRNARDNDTLYAEVTAAF